MTLEEMRRRKAELGLTNEMLAEVTGVPLGTVQKILSGRTKSPHYATLRKLEGALRERESSYLEHLDNYTRKILETIPEDNSFYQVVGQPSVVRDGGAAAYRVKKQGEYTIRDYLAMPKERRAELIDGTLFEMEAPNGKHQRVIVAIAFILESFVRRHKGTCHVEVSPRDVRLDRDDKTVVQPDVMVVCDPEKLTLQFIEGAPDLVIEVLSESTGKKDMLIKSGKYYRAGVREYWMIDPETETVIVYHFETGTLQLYSFDDTVPVAVWDGACRVDFKEIREDLKVYRE